MLKVMFLCTDNLCRSQMVERIARHSSQSSTGLMNLALGILPVPQILLMQNEINGLSA